MDRWTLSAHRFRQLAIVTTAGLCLLVVAGGVVRLTGSGLGCDDWPNCNAESFVDVSSGHTAIEQLNRLLSALIGIPTLAMAIGCFRVRPRRDGLVWPSLGVLFTVLGNGVVGGMAVRYDLHPALVQSHFLLAMASIACALIAARRAGPLAPAGEPEPPVGSSLRMLAWVVAVLTAAALVTGTVVTGTGPHAGDQDVRRWGFAIATVARIHSITVLVTIAAALVFAFVLRSNPALRQRHWPALETWMFVAVVQGGIGYLQYYTGVPELLVGAHLAGATALWVVTVWMCSGVLAAPSAPVRVPVGVTTAPATRSV